MGNNHVSEPGEVYLTKLKATAYFYFRCFSIYKQVESVLNLQTKGLKSCRGGSFSSEQWPCNWSGVKE